MEEDGGPDKTENCTGENDDDSDSNSYNDNGAANDSDYFNDNNDNDIDVDNSNDNDNDRKFGEADKQKRTITQQILIEFKVLGALQVVYLKRLC